MQQNERENIYYAYTARRRQMILSLQALFVRCNNKQKPHKIQVHSNDDEFMCEMSQCASVAVPLYFVSKTIDFRNPLSPRLAVAHRINTNQTRTLKITILFADGNPAPLKTVLKLDQNEIWFEEGPCSDSNFEKTGYGVVAFFKRAKPTEDEVNARCGSAQTLVNIPSVSYQIKQALQKHLQKMLLISEFCESDCAYKLSLLQGRAAHRCL